MINIIRASFYKLIKDWTFRITMIVGLGVGVMMILINWGLGSLNGESMLISSASPTQNFGLTVPINLIVFTIGEFTYGTIRNKIIAGHTKLKLYIGLFITGLIFTYSLMVVYLAFVVGISSLAGGFDVSSFGGPAFVGYFIAYIFTTYLFVTSLSVFFGTLFRSIGGSISVVVILLVMIGLLPLILTLSLGKGFEPNNLQMWLNPVYFIGLYGSSSAIISLLKEFGADVSKFFIQSPDMVAAGIVTPLYWSTIFFVCGALIFTHRDVK